MKTASSKTSKKSQIPISHLLHLPCLFILSSFIDRLIFLFLFTCFLVRHHRCFNLLSVAISILLHPLLISYTSSHKQLGEQGTLAFKSTHFKRTLFPQLAQYVGVCSCGQPLEPLLLLLLLLGLFLSTHSVYSSLSLSLSTCGWHHRLLLGNAANLVNPQFLSI